MYDTMADVPPPGSPLSTLFLLTHLERRQADLLATRAMIQALIAGDNKDPAIKAYEAYHDHLFPFLERAKDTEHDEAMKVLKEFVKRNARIDLRPIYKAQHDNAKRAANYRRFSMSQRLAKYRMGHVPETK